MARFWVGGATGFLGSHLLRALAADGHQVIAASKSGGVVGDVSVTAVDVLDADAVAKSAEGSEFALLAFGLVSRDPADAERLFELHVRGTERVLEGLKRAGVKRVVYASTSGTRAAGRDAARVYDELHPSSPELVMQFPYYRSKWFGERLALEANRPGAFEVVVVNPSLLLGPGDVRESSTRDVRLFLEGRITVAPRGGLSFVDVRDAASAMVHAATLGQNGEFYFLTAQNVSIEAWFDRLSRLSGVPAPKLKLPRNPGLAREATRAFNRVLSRLGGQPVVDEHSVELGQYYWYCSAEKAIRELGFSPRDPSATLRDTVTDLVERGAAFPRTGHFRRPEA